MSKRVKKYGTKAEVWAGDATMTRGKLLLANLKANSRGKIVSRRKSEQSSERLKTMLQKRKNENVTQETPTPKTRRTPKRDIRDDPPKKRRRASAIVKQTGSEQASIAHGKTVVDRAFDQVIIPSKL